MRRLGPWRLGKREDGQVILWLAFSIPIIVLFAAMAIDMGLIYQAKARLSNAVDAAVLTGAKNYSQGIPTAQDLGTKMFVANYGSSAPTLAWTWCPSNPSCSGGDLSATLHAAALVNTTFMAYLPRWAQWTIGATSQATRSNLVLSLVLDRSGSMNSNNGGTALKSAVPNFIADFLNGTDHLAMISFAGNARVDVAMTTNFQTAINSAVSNLVFDGATFGTGAGTLASHDLVNGPPLNLADDQNNSVSFPAGQPETKVVVYFTDGLMNTVQNTLSCTNGGNTLYNFGGYDAVSSPTCDLGSDGKNRCFDFMDPTKDTYETGDRSILYAEETTYQTPTGTSSVGCGPYDPTRSPTHHYFCQKSVPFNASKSCVGPTTFPSQVSGGNVAFTRANITADAQYRAKYTANQLRNESPFRTYIYVIGLGSQISNDKCTEAFLATLANDPDADPSSGVYPCASSPGSFNKDLPVGKLEVVPDCPSTACTAELNDAFQKIASMVLLRLTQ